MLKLVTQKVAIYPVSIQFSSIPCNTLKNRPIPFAIANCYNDYMFKQQQQQHLFDEVWFGGGRDENLLDLFGELGPGLGNYADIISILDTCRITSLVPWSWSIL